NNRHIVAHALNNQLDQAEFWIDPVFGFEVPKTLPEMPAEILDPRQSAKDIKDYQRRARDLAAKFAKNFEQFKGVSTEIVAAGPRA
ncbi:MAG: phosphoenolpyruvate carboxykinase (ATP), partial [Verrucomicrobiia bacterium]